MSPTMNAYLAAAITANQPDDNSVRTGQVVSTDGTTLGVLINGAVVPCGYLSNWVPAVGQSVALIRQGADWLALGPMSGPASPEGTPTGWEDWSPVLTNITVGSGGVVTARRRILNGSCDWRFKFVMGTGSAIGTNPAFTLPAVPHPSYTPTQNVIGRGTLRDEGSANRDAVVRILTAPVTAFVLAYSSTGDHSTVSATTPWTWSAANGDAFSVEGSFEIAESA